MRIVFMGTPAFSVPILQALVDAGHDIAACYTQPPRRAGRGKAMTPSPVQARAEAIGIAVQSPASLRTVEAQSEFAALGSDLAVVAAYGLILPPPILAAPRLGCLNVHASLLPRWRGAAPIQRAILAGDAESGVCIMRMEAGLDTGPVLAERRVAIGGMTGGALTEMLSTVGATLMVEVLGDLDAYPERPQPDDGITYAAKIDKAEARIDWTQPAMTIERQVRAFNPVPGAFIEVGGERVKLLAASVVDADFSAPPGQVVDSGLTIMCGDERALRPTLLQRAGRGAMATDDLLRGFPILPGTQL